MKHIKKFNENLSYLDYEDFMTIIETDLLDKFDYEVSFHDYSSSEFEDDRFYDCAIFLQENEEPDNYYYESDSSTFGFLNTILPDYEAPEPLENPESIIDKINQQSARLEKIRNNLTVSINKQAKLSSFISILISKTIPRLEQFSNIIEVQIGFEVNDIRICANIKPD